MTDLIPFDGLVYNHENIKNLDSIITQPYDKIDEILKKEYLLKSDHNAVRLILPDPTIIENPDSKYINSRDTLRSWKEKNILKHLGNKSFYYLIQEFESPITKEIIIRKGFIGLLRFTDFSEKIVFPHEKTLSKPKEDRFKLTLATNTYFEQIFLLFDDDNNQILNTFDIELSKNPNSFKIYAKDEYNVKNTLYVLNKLDFTNKIHDMFNNKQFVIADGHHRYETGLNYMKYMKERNISSNGSESYHYGMMFFCPSNEKGLIILPTHRLVHGLDSFSLSSFINNIEKTFEVRKFSNIEDFKKAQNEGLATHSFGFYSKYDFDNFYLFTLNKNPMEILSDKTEAMRDLDVTILHTLILDKELGIDEERLKQQSNINYIRDLNEGINKVKNNEEQLLFILNPTTVSQVMRVSQSGFVMPQKSTDFYPKLATGLVIYEM